ncbi:MAG: NAD(P)-dependent alcohol dehydrogenase [Candidatus Thorarchaeota archaeon]
MKAIVSDRYGSPESLQYLEVEQPYPKANEVLIKVHASSLNAADFEILRGAWTARFTGLRRPGQRIPGSDVAGVIVTVGSAVSNFLPGDAIVGDLFYSGKGAWAEYVCAPVDVLTHKSPNMTFEQAAAYPHAAIVVIQCLRDKRQIEPGDKVLINGAGGGMGTFAVQIAKYYGAEVTAVDSAMKLDMLRTIGADNVIDYAQEDFTKIGETYDIVLDTVAKRSLRKCKGVLNPDGLYVMVGGSRRAIFEAAFIGPIISRRDSRHLGLNLWGRPYNAEDMSFLEQLFDEGHVKPIIDKVYSLSEIPEALTRLENGQALGKLVVTMNA